MTFLIEQCLKCLRKKIVEVEAHPYMICKLMIIYMGLRSS